MQMHRMHRVSVVIGWCLVVGVSINSIAHTHGFYLPGVAPQDFQKGDEVIVRVGRVSSAKTHIPFDYYELPLCEKEETTKDKPSNLGEILAAERYHDAPFALKALENETCSLACFIPGEETEQALLEQLVKNDYFVRIHVDNMPGMYLNDHLPQMVNNQAGQSTSSLSDKIFQLRPKDNGYPLGVDSPNLTPPTFINNHITLWIMYHKLKTEYGMYSGKNRIIAVYITTKSYNSEDENTWLSTCQTVEEKGINAEKGPQTLKGNDYRMTYSVRWVETDKIWATRWDALLSMENYEHDTNWSAIINSILLSLLLGFLVAIIMMRSVKNDFALLRELEAEDDLMDYDQSNVSWKLLSRDVFREPDYALLLSILHGNGVQLFWMVFLQMVFALLGFYSPSNRGAFLSYSFIAYACLAVKGGKSASSLYGSFGGMDRRRLVLGVSMLVPGIAYISFFLINLALWIMKSSGAIPFLTLLYITFLWFGITLPLTFFGAYLGFKVPIEWPIRSTKIPRLIPEKSCFLRLPTLMVFGGITLYSMTFIQVFSITQKLWLHQFVYMFGFLFLTGLCFLIGCVEISIIAVYVTLCNEDYKWWWKAFIVPASSGLFMFVGTLIYQILLTEQYFEGVTFMTFWMMSTYLGLTCLGVSLISGSVGLSSCMWFTKMIYARCKPE